MYNPFGGNKFPYTNFHELNLDWIIEIAKNFLDQYTHIQETIDTGLEDLEAKATELEGLLQAWYDEHSEDIADALAEALASLNAWYLEHQDDISADLASALAALDTAIAEKVAAALASIPGDYDDFFAAAYKNQYLAASNFDLNSVDINSVYQIDGTRSPQHYPSQMGTKSGILITNLFTSDGSIRSQMLIGFTLPAILIRTYTSSTWSDWQSADNYQFGILTSSDNLNNISLHSKYVVLAGNVPSNYPPDMGTLAGIVETTPVYGEDFIFQVCTRFTTGNQYYRIKSSGTWGSWGTFPGGAICNYGGAIATSRNIDQLPMNSVYSVASGSSYPTGYPMETAGLIFTIQYSPNYGLQFVFPFFITSNTIANIEKAKIYARYTNNYPTWTDWIMYKTPRRDATAKYIAFGDSISWGYSADQNHAQSRFNYPTMISNMIGIKVTNKAVPGQGLLKDWDDIIADIETTDFTNVKLITVGWAYNDSTVIPSYAFGSPTDPIPASTSGITTWLGFYAKILSILQDKAPAAQVILITGYGQPSGSDPDHLLDYQFNYQRVFTDGSKTIKEMYDGLETMANYYGFNCINQAKGTVINRFNSTTIIGDTIHPTYDGYRIYGDFIASKVAALFNNQN